jgi:hypothetical protein
MTAISDRQYLRGEIGWALAQNNSGPESSGPCIEQNC